MLRMCGLFSFYYLVYLLRGSLSTEPEILLSQVAECVTRATLFVGDFPARFASHVLDDVTAEEGTRAYFTVELTQLGGKVQWCIDGQPIVENNKYQTVAVGSSRTLAVVNCQRGSDDSVSIFVK